MTLSSPEQVPRTPNPTVVTSPPRIEELRVRRRLAHYDNMWPMNDNMWPRCCLFHEDANDNHENDDAMQLN